MRRLLRWAGLQKEFGLFLKSFSSKSQERGMVRVWFGCFGTALLVLCGGCGSDGPEVNYVEGQVTLDGSPLPGATVTFSPLEGGSGRPATGVTDSGGTYTLTDVQSDEVGSGAAAGEYRVGIVKVASGGQQGHDASQNDPNHGDMPDPNATVKLESEIPTKYNKPETSGLTATVESGRNENLDFELTSSP